PCGQATSHGAYVSCVRRVVSAALEAGTLPHQCKRSVVHCAVRSMCGRSAAARGCAAGNDTARCRVVRSASRCANGTVVTAASCCDPCGGSTTTSSSSTTSTAPAASTTSTSTTTSTTPDTTPGCGAPYVCDGPC